VPLALGFRFGRGIERVGGSATGAKYL
jgi:hypothetical protein